MTRTSTSLYKRGQLVAWGLALACLGGCGNKGPLYLPDSKPQARKPADIAPPAPQRPQPSEALPPPQ